MAARGHLRPRDLNLQERKHETTLKRCKTLCWSVSQGALDLLVLRGVSQAFRHHCNLRQWLRETGQDASEYVELRALESCHPSVTGQKVLGRQESLGFSNRQLEREFANGRVYGPSCWARNLSRPTGESGWIGGVGVGATGLLKGTRTLKSNFDFYLKTPSHPQVTRL